MKEHITIDVDNWYKKRFKKTLFVWIAKYLPGGCYVTSDGLPAPSPVYEYYRILGPIYFRWKNE